MSRWKRALGTARHSITDTVSNEEVSEEMVLAFDALDQSIQYAAIGGKVQNTDFVALALLYGKQVIETDLLRDEIERLRSAVASLMPTKEEAEAAGLCVWPNSSRLKKLGKG